MLRPTIVCGVDGSASADGAVVLARTLSEWLEWRLVVVHVADVPLVPGASVIPGAHVELRGIGLDQGEELLDAVFEKHALPQTAKRRVEVGARAERLLAVCEEEDADLLVVGSRGRGRIASALFGGLSMRIAACAPCPVAVVPECASVSSEVLGRSKRMPTAVATLAVPAQRRA